MKAFFIGLLFLISVLILTGLGILLFPLLVALGWLFQFFLMLGFAIFAIWALGKLVIFAWEVLASNKNTKECSTEKKSKSLLKKIT